MSKASFMLGFIAGVTSVGGVVAQKEPVAWLTFSSDEPFTVSKTRTWDGVLYYSTDTHNWSEWDGKTIASAEHMGGQKIYMRGIGNSKINDNSLYSMRIEGSKVRCDGNIENLLDYKVVANGQHPVMGDSCYYYLFDSCKSLTHAPDLPATKLTKQCYAHMFSNCTSLVHAPKLPATALAELCYYWMFYKCASLASEPELPATTLAEQCYSRMFSNCTSLVHAPKLPATVLAKYCYSNMFEECSSLISLPELPATTLANYCYTSMFRECSNIKMSVTQTGEYQTPYRIPTTGTGTSWENSLGGSSLSYMFSDTGGTFTGTPEINTTYYTSNTVV